MEENVWVKILSGFRVEDHPTLMISLGSGLEIAVQNIARVEPEVVLIRGRVAGSADVGRLFVLPYSDLSCIYVNRLVKIEEVELFSPTVSPERKAEVARMVEEAARKAKEDAERAERERQGGGAAPATPAADVTRELESLREKMGAAQPATTESRPVSVPIGNIPRSAPGMPQRPSALPTRPTRPGGGGGGTGGSGGDNK